MKLSTKAKEFELNGKNKIFKGSDYENGDFSIIFVQLNQQKLIEVYKSNSSIVDGKEEIDFVNLGLDQLLATIKSWTGICDENEVELDLTKENVSNIMNYDSNFFNIILKESENFFSKKKK